MDDETDLEAAQAIFHALTSMTTEQLQFFHSTIHFLHEDEDPKTWPSVHVAILAAMTLVESGLIKAAVATEVLWDVYDALCEILMRVDPHDLNEDGRKRLSKEVVDILRNHGIEVISIRLN